MATQTDRLKWFLLVAPWMVLVLTRVGISYSTGYFRPEISWIPSFMGYYLSISLMVLIAQKYFSIPFSQFVSLSFRPYPGLKWLFWGVIFPALLPVAAFVLQLKYIPFEFIIYILIFALINPLFEEGFWRGLLSFYPGNKRLCIVYSAGLFSFSHWLFWGYWFKTPAVIIPTVISTFIMGMMWMGLIQRNRNLLYPILSHILVDIFNLSVAVYYGLIPPTH